MNIGMVIGNVTLTSFEPNGLGLRLRLRRMRQRPKAEVLTSSTSPSTFIAAGEPSIGHLTLDAFQQQKIPTQIRRPKVQSSTDRWSHFQRVGHGHESQPSETG